MYFSNNFVTSAKLSKYDEISISMFMCVYVCLYLHQYNIGCVLEVIMQASQYTLIYLNRHLSLCVCHGLVCVCVYMSRRSSIYVCAYASCVCVCVCVLIYPVVYCQQNLCMGLYCMSHTQGLDTCQSSKGKRETERERERQRERERERGDYSRKPFLISGWIYMLRGFPQLISLRSTEGRRCKRACVCVCLCVCMLDDRSTVSKIEASVFLLLFKLPTTNGSGPVGC